MAVSRPERGLAKGEFFFQEKPSALREARAVIGKIRAAKGEEARRENGNESVRVDNKTKTKGSAVKTSDLLNGAFHLIGPAENRLKQTLARNSMGMRTHPEATDVDKYSTVGALMKMLSKYHEDTSTREALSTTQKLFVSDAYCFLSDSAQQLGFGTISDLDEFGSHEQWYHMWEIAIANAMMAEEEEESNA